MNHDHVVNDKNLNFYINYIKSHMHLLKVQLDNLSTPWLAMEGRVDEYDLEEIMWECDLNLAVIIIEWSCAW